MKDCAGGAFGTGAVPWDAPRVRRAAADIPTLGSDNSYQNVKYTLSTDNSNTATVYGVVSTSAVTGDDNNLVIPAQVQTSDGTTYNVTAIDENAFTDCSALASVTVPGSVTSIGGSAFSSMKSGAVVTFEGTAALTTAGEDALKAYESRPLYVVAQGDRLASLNNSLPKADRTSGWGMLVAQAPQSPTFKKTNPAGTLKAANSYAFYAAYGNYSVNGLKGDNAIKTTYDDYGYYTYLSTEVTPTISNAKAVAFPGAGVESYVDGVWVKVDTDFVSGGNYLRVTYTLRSGTSADIPNVSLGVLADVQIGKDDYASIYPTPTGFRMVNTESSGDDPTGSGMQFTLNCQNAPGADDVDTMWYGKYSDRNTSLFTDLADKAALTDTDSGLAFSWQNMTVPDSGTITKSVLFGVGAEAAPPALPSDEDSKPIALYLTAEGEKDITVNAKVTDAEGVTDTLYYTINGGTEQALGETVTADGSPQTIAGIIGADNFAADGTYEINLWIMNSKGAMSEVVTKTLTVTSGAMGGGGLEIGSAPVNPTPPVPVPHSDHPVCGGSSCLGDHTGHSGRVTYTELTQEMLNGTSAIAPLGSGSYYLAGDLTIQENLNFFINGDINLCLNGHTLNLGGNQLIQTGGTLNLCDCRGTGKILRSSDTAVGLSHMFECGKDNQPATLNLYGGTLESNVFGANNMATSALRIASGSTANLYGGTVTQTNTNDATKYSKTAILNCGALRIYGGTVSNATGLPISAAGNMTLSGSPTITAGNSMRPIEVSAGGSYQQPTFSTIHAEDYTGEALKVGSSQFQWGTGGSVTYLTGTLIRCASNDSNKGKFTVVPVKVNGVALTVELAYDEANHAWIVQDKGSTPPAAPAPTVDGANIFAGGLPVRIVAGSTENYTNILYDKDGDGAIGDAEYLKIGSNAPTAAGYDLSEYSVWGGGKSAAVDNTSITMTGCKVEDLFGGGWDCKVTGKATIHVSGGNAKNICGGSTSDYNNASVYTTAQAEISITGGVIDTVFAGGGNAEKTPTTIGSVTVKGTAHITMVWFGGTATRSLTVGENAQIDGLFLNDDSSDYGVDSFAIDPNLGKDASIVLLFLGALPDGRVVATGAVASDLVHVSIHSEIPTAASYSLELDGTSIKVRKTVVPAQGGTVTLPLSQENLDDVFGEGNAEIDADTDPGTITIKNDITAKDAITIPGDVTINLGGNTITGPEGKPAITVTGEDTDLTVTGPGSVIGGAGTAPNGDGAPAIKNESTGDSAIIIGGGANITGGAGSGTGSGGSGIDSSSGGSTVIGGGSTVTGGNGGNAGGNGGNGITGGNGSDVVVGAPGNGTGTGGNGGNGGNAETEGNGGQGGAALGGSVTDSSGGSLTQTNGKNGLNAKVEIKGNPGTTVKIPDAGKAVDAVLTETEKQNANITEVTVTLTVENKTTEKPNKDKVETAKPANTEVGAYFDIALQKTVTENGTAKEPESVTDVPSGKITVTITIPADMRGGSNYVIIRVHNDSAETITPTQSGNDLTFETDKFSTYAIAYTPAGGGDPTPPVDNDGSAPSYKPEGQDTKLPFTDVAESDWFYESVKYAYENGLMIGTAADRFSPYTTASRGMVVTILWRLEGEPTATGANPFADVSADAYCAKAVAWAAENGIVSGYGNGLFGSNDPITREQMASILYRYADKRGYDVTGEAGLSGFTDTNSISPWASRAIRWANSNGLINGKGDGILDPRGYAERCQVASILHRFCENIIK